MVMWYPDDLGTRPKASQAEREAMTLARNWVKADPFYHGRPLTVREEALMMLALRCMTAPEGSNVALLNMQPTPAVPVKLCDGCGRMRSVRTSDGQIRRHQDRSGHTCPGSTMPRSATKR